MNSKTGCVYWQETYDGMVYIGSTENPGQRQGSHTRNGFTLLAARPGSESDEHAVQDQLGPPARGKSIWAGDEVWEWLVWLMARGFVAQTYEEAVLLDHIPVALWSPDALRSYVDVDGQLGLLDELPARNRIAYMAEFGQLHSISDEWNSPLHMIEAARRVMGSIDCDPATNLEAQQDIDAKVFYSKQTDGLRGDAIWAGNVWLNPPYGRGDRSAGAFVAGLVERFERGETVQAVTCLNLNSTSSNWFRPLWDVASRHCVHYGRPNFRGKAVKVSSPTKGIILSYLGDRVDEFAEEFAPHGAVIMRV